MSISEIKQDKKLENRIENTYVAWLFPSLERGNYWHPILSEFTKKFPHTTVYTGGWAGFSPGFQDAFTVEVVGTTRYITTVDSSTEYSRSYILPSFDIISHLLRFKPQVIFTSAYSLWTVFVLLLKLFFRWKVVIIFDGVSVGKDRLNSGFRIFPRRLMNLFVDAFITNSSAAKNYLTKVVWAKESKIFVKRYLVPDIKALLPNQKVSHVTDLQTQRPIFLFVGQVIPRKGIHLLLEACSILNEKGYCNYTLLIVGDGTQRQELETLTRDRNLQNCVNWIGQVDYHKLGDYFGCADVFVFPTLEDIWGMVVLEAMVFGKPILCSQRAGAAEMVVVGENGYTFDPYNPENLADLMMLFIKHPELIEKMGKKSSQQMVNHTPITVSESLTEIVEFTLKTTVHK
ncbi:glycosyltransferase [Scytonema sp. UIC 10036]|uniref:glycosyltransferase family 4 protein n=1 Tax=Scytonema sp. UIC 10036 TaxID=2304196 RepID=UPI0012DA475C|nr:glycosyltransferase family 4 protein [Scytonema sp. UIC 10036]MUG96760.1 glycosyltransferase [Scytonema sp. UIC 10036]